VPDVDESGGAVPTYQYACTACDHRFDAVQSFTESSLTVCPQCSGRLRKVFSAVGVVFKGSGFYRTDSRAPEGANGSSGKDSAADKVGAKDPAGKDSGPKESWSKDSAARQPGSNGSGANGSREPARTGAGSKDSRSREPGHNGSGPKGSSAKRGSAAAGAGSSSSTGSGSAS
jgi:putative FmdB family regulatory protein